MRERIGLLVRVLGNYLLPSTAMGCFAYFSGDLAPGLKWLLAAGVSLGMAVSVFLIVLLGDRIATGGILDTALKQGIAALASCLRIPEQSFNDPKAPVIRVTVFVPEKRWGNPKERLYPRFRWDCLNGKVLAYGDVGFNTTQPFDKGDVMAGLSWQDGSSHYENLLAVGDFDGKASKRPEKWAQQWQALGPCNPLKWGEYTRNVRSAWTFPVLAPAATEGEPGCLAVFTVDSTFEKAFHSAEEHDPRSSENKSSCLADVHQRTMIVYQIQSIILVTLKRRVIDVFRTHFLTKSKGPMVIGLSSEPERPLEKKIGDG